MPQRTTAAAILRGGLARRFGGQDKSRLVVDGRTIIVRQVEVLQRVASEIFIVGARAGETSDAGLAVHADRIPGMGVIGGIFTALDVTEADAVVVVGCDLPFLDAGVLAELVRLAATADGAWVRTARGPEPLIACYRRHARRAIRDAIQAGRVKASDLGTILRLAELAGDALAAFGPVDRLLTNVNTPDEYARIR